MAGSKPACAPMHADRRRQDTLATHGYENTDWFFNMVLCVFMVKQKEIMLTFIENITIEKIFKISLRVIINTLIVFIIIVLILGLAKTIYSIKKLIPIEHFTNGFNHIITDILSFLVILELFRSFVEYFKSKRFRLHSMMDPFIIFVVRELLVILYTHEKVVWQNIIGFAILVLSLGIVRTLAVIYTPESEKIK